MGDRRPSQEGGCPGRRSAAAVGAQHSTVLRQYQSRGPVFTARPAGPNGDDGQGPLRRAATKLVHATFPTTALQNSPTGRLYLPVQAMADSMLTPRGQAVAHHSEAGARRGRRAHGEGLPGHSTSRTWTSRTGGPGSAVRGGAVDVIVWQTGTARLLPRLLRTRATFSLPPSRRPARC
jgi:hypothetical protein